MDNSNYVFCQLQIPRKTSLQIDLFCLNAKIAGKRLTKSDAIVMLAERALAESPEGKDLFFNPRIHSHDNVELRSTE